MHPAEVGWIRAISVNVPRQNFVEQTTRPATPPRRRAVAPLLCLLALLAGCTPPSPATSAMRCPPGQGSPMLAFELFFGRSIRGQAEVSDSAWDDFLTRMVTPNLPNGYTVSDAIGAWRIPNSSHRA